MGWREQAPGFGLLCWLLFPLHHGFVTVCAHCLFRLKSGTLSPGDEAGQITLSTQPTHSVQNEECEQQSEKFDYCIFHSKLFCAEVASCTL